MIWIIVIVIAATIFFAGIIIVIAQMTVNKNETDIYSFQKEHVITDGGVDAKDLHYGKKKGLDFIAGRDMYGTVIRSNGAAHRMWNACFTFLDNGRKEAVVFRTKMAVGRKREAMKLYPYLEIVDDRMISSVHCYLVGSNKGLVVLDAGSLNHTYVNGMIVNSATSLPNGSELRIGHTRLYVTYKYR